MPKSISIAARIDEALDAEIERLAAVTGRTKSALVADALSSYVESEKQFIEAVEAGLEDLRSGKIVEHDAVIAAVRRAIKTPR